MNRWAVVQASKRPWTSEPGPCTGMRSKTLVGLDQGAAHLEVSLVELEPGGEVSGHIHPFEESFYILDGTAAIGIAEQTALLGPHDFGYAPVATPHSWKNPGNVPVRWLRVRSPQPKPLGAASASYPVQGYPLPDTTTPATAHRPRYVGHFDPAILPGPGPIQLKGFRSSGATNVGLYMLIDEVMGAVHHTLFVVEFHPTGPEMTLGGQHFHPFEEIYYIVEGEAVAHLEDESIPVEPGDLVFAGVNSLHGFSNPTDRPVRWIEAQAPAPPPSGAFFFRSDWEMST